MNFKQQYSKLLMRFVLDEVEECSTATKVVNLLNVLHAIKWISQAWNEITSDVIKKVGILNKTFQVVHRQEAEEDPLIDLDDDDDTFQVDKETQDLITQLKVYNACAAEELSFVDEDLTVCAEQDDDTWDETILSSSSSKSPHAQHPGDVSDDESEEDSDNYVPPVPILNSYSIQARENVSHFLEYQGHTAEMTEVMT